MFAPHWSRGVIRAVGKHAASALRAARACARAAFNMAKQQNPPKGGFCHAGQKGGGRRGGTGGREGREGVDG